MAGPLKTKSASYIYAAEAAGYHDWTFRVRAKVRQHLSKLQREEGSPRTCVGGAQPPRHSRMLPTHPKVFPPVPPAQGAGRKCISGGAPGHSPGGRGGHRPRPIPACGVLRRHRDGSDSSADDEQPAIVIGLSPTEGSAGYMAYSTRATTGKSTTYRVDLLTIVFCTTTLGM